jgi:hypothetical protein
MSSTLIKTCPLCGLRSANNALLELHLREDHPRQKHRVAPDPGDSGDSGTPQRRAANDLASRQARPEKAVTPTTRTRRLHHEGPGWAIIALRQAIRTLRYVNDELLCASEAIIGSARAPQRRPLPEAPAGTDGQSAPDRAERADRAA